jgi:hypothetical protein
MTASATTAKHALSFQRTHKPHSDTPYLCPPPGGPPLIDPYPSGHTDTYPPTSLGRTGPAVRGFCVSPGQRGTSSRGNGLMWEEGIHSLRMRTSFVAARRLSEPSGSQQQGWRSATLLLFPSHTAASAALSMIQHR